MSREFVLLDGIENIMIKLLIKFLVPAQWVSLNNPSSTVISMMKQSDTVFFFLLPTIKKIEISVFQIFGLFV